MATTDDFFCHKKEQSAVKIEIVSKYFRAWGNVLKHRWGMLGYADPFCGPGYYENPTTHHREDSTPLIILKQTIADPVLRGKMRTWFNDENSISITLLRKAVVELPGIETLRYPPIITNNKVTSELPEMFGSFRRMPTFFFIDPFGYSGLTLAAITAALKDTGCDCIFFFNTSRIIRSLNIPSVTHHFDELFGPERAAELREKMPEIDIDEKERAVIEALRQAINATYFQAFPFRDSSGRNTKHHIIFVTKNLTALTIMRHIMGCASSSAVQGVPTLEYNPAQHHQPNLFDTDHPLDDLEDQLLREYTGFEVTLEDIHASYLKAHPESRYVEANFRQAVLSLEAQGKVCVEVPAEMRRKRNGAPTLAKRYLIIFPKRKT